MTAKDYSGLYCPRCLKPLPASGDHWRSCREYEADSDEAPLTKLAAYKERVERLDTAIEFSKARLIVQQEKRDKAQAELEKLMLEAVNCPD